MASVKLIAFLALSLPAAAQSWTNVSTETASAITLSAGSTYRVGADGCWSQSISVPKGVVLLFPLIPNTCAKGIVRELDVLQTDKPQIVIIGKSAVTVAPAVSTPPAPTLVATYTCTVNVYSDGTFKSSNCKVAP